MWRIIPTNEAAKIAEQSNPTVLDIINILSNAIKADSCFGKRFSSWSFDKSAVSLEYLEEAKIHFSKLGYVVEIITDSPVSNTFKVNF
nr:hypothetical protein [Acinetobacter baumannii]EKV0014282.1 hypothetical protein [Acinetobacter baumannii]EKV0022094.1 hypothetical protein [Acinetobacter baumannii]EKV2181998.1 hypothetical protein [Acinetobacter baumannii]